ncbi:MAG: hypothetical protein ACOY4U_10995 [Pseudomonadota bacterium]
MSIARPPISRARTALGLAVAAASLAASLGHAAEQPVFLKAPTRVTTTTDTKGVGYPDARKIVADSRGTLTLAYRTQAPGDAAHVFVVRNSNGSWGTPMRAENINGLIQRVPAIGVGSDDSTHVSWYGIDPIYKSPTDYRQIKYTSATRDGNWSGDSSSYYNIAPIKDTTNCLSSSKWWQEHPAIQVGKGKVNGSIKADVAFIAWESRDSASCTKGQVRFYAKPLDGSAAGFSVKIPSVGSSNFSRPTVVPSTDGSTLHALAYGSGNGTRQITWTTSSDGGKTWGAWKLISSNSNDQRHVSAAVDANNNLHVAWREQVGSYSNIMYGVWNGSGWTRRNLTATQPSAFRTFPSISVFRTDATAGAPEKVAVVWVQAATAPSEEVETRGNVMLSVRDGISSSANAGSWSTPLQLNARAGSGVSNGQATYPSLRWSQYGAQAYVDVVWADGASGSNPLQCPSGGCPIFYSRLNAAGAAAAQVATAPTATAEPAPPADSTTMGGSTTTSTSGSTTTSGTTTTSSTSSTLSILRNLLSR